MTDIVMLGTGTPRPDPNRSGPATAIIAGGIPYLVDFGPGVVRRAAAAYERGVHAFGAGGVNIRHAFLTHLHSDHTIGYPDLILTPWVMGRHDPLDVHGPRGLAAMTDHILAAWRIDIEARIHGINGHNETGCKVKVHEIDTGIVHRDENVTVTAFRVRHEEMVDSFGFRFEAADRTIVLSGDTAPTQTLIDYAVGCDVLIHEVYSLAAFARVSPRAQAFRRVHHTSTQELAAIANACRPGLLLLYHRGNAGGGMAPEPDEIVLDEIRRHYDGRVVMAGDLETY